MYPHHEIDEQPNKKPKKVNYSHKRKESDDKNAVGCCEKCTTIGLRLARLGSIGISKRKTVPGKPDVRKFWKPIQRVRFTKSTLRQASIREKKGPSLGKIQVKNHHQRSPYAVKFEDRSHTLPAREQRRTTHRSRRRSLLPISSLAHGPCPRESCVGGAPGCRWRPRRTHLSQCHHQPSTPARFGFL